MAIDFLYSLLRFIKFEIQNNTVVTVPVHFVFWYIKLSLFLIPYRQPTFLNPKKDVSKI